MATDKSLYYYLSSPEDGNKVVTIASFEHIYGKEKIIEFFKSIYKDQNSIVTVKQFLDDIYKYCNFSYAEQVFRCFFLSGYCKGFYLNGVQSFETHFKNGDTHGKIKKWYDNGQIKTCFDFVNGKYEGKFELWFKNGQKQTEEVYVNGKRLEYKKWYEDGVVKSCLKSVD